jgi:hypothetical protein
MKTKDFLTIIFILLFAGCLFHYVRPAVNRAFDKVMDNIGQLIQNSIRQNP